MLLKMEYEKNRWSMCGKEGELKMEGTRGR